MLERQVHANLAEAGGSSTFSAPTFPSSQKKPHSQYNSGVRNGLWDWKHIQKMGSALGLFGWLVSRQTAQNGSAGLVLGGKPLRLEEICGDLNGAPRRSVQRWLQVLRRWGYIETKAKPRGIIITIRNAKKEKWSQKSLFPAAPEVAHHTCARSGAPRDKSGAPPTSVPIDEFKRKTSKRGHPLFQEIIEYAFEAYEKAKDFKPSWTPREDFRAVKELLQAQPNLRLEEFQRVFQNYLASDKKFYREKGWRLKYACADFDALRHGPIFERGGNHGAATTRKTSSRSNADPRAARFRQVGRKASDFAQRAH